MPTRDDYKTFEDEMFRKIEDLEREEVLDKIAEKHEVDRVRKEVNSILNSLDEPARKRILERLVRSLKSDIDSTQ
ncbi:MAG TPA: hypothetical protein VN622_12900 [Clostridia bacterium]|nr:hypothetical protein [Clostridia bacterium]